MIINAHDIDAVFKDLSKTDSTAPNLMNETMNAEEFNTSFHIIEAQLNRLYEKIRLLDDVADFTKNYITTEIASKEDRCREQLKVIEERVNEYHNKQTISQQVKFEPSIDTITDRTGATIPQFTIINNHLEVPGRITHMAALSSIITSPTSSRYKETQTTINNKHIVMSYYINTSTADTIIREQVAISLKDKNTYNYLYINPVNCQIKNMTTNNEPLFSDSSVNSGYFSPKVLDTVTFTTECAHYEYGYNSLLNIEKELEAIKTISITSNDLYIRKENAKNIKDTEKYIISNKNKKNISSFDREKSARTINNADIIRKNQLIKER